MDKIKHYNSKNVYVDFSAEGIPQELEKCINKRVKRIVNDEYSLYIIFEDDTFIEANGHTFDGCSLSVNVDKE